MSVRLTRKELRAKTDHELLVMLVYELRTMRGLMERDLEIMVTERRSGAEYSGAIRNVREEHIDIANEQLSKQAENLLKSEKDERLLDQVRKLLDTDQTTDAILLYHQSRGIDFSLASAVIDLILKEQ